MADSGVNQIHIDLAFPKNWKELMLKQKKLYYMFFLLSQDLGVETVKTLALLRFNNIKIIGREGTKYLVEKEKMMFLLDPIQFAEVSGQLDFLGDIPGDVVFLKRIRFATACDEYFRGIPFSTYLMCENYYQGFIHQQDYSLLNPLGALLYPGLSKNVKLNKTELTSLFYWFSSLKKYFSTQFPFFFKPFDSSEETSMSLKNQLQTNMQAQIRALSKGDVTKVDKILETDTWQALAELDAQAKEAAEFNNKYGNK